MTTATPTTTTTATPTTTPTAPPQPPLSPQERAKRARELRLKADIVFMDKARAEEALRMFTELVPDDENMLRIARWHYIEKNYQVAWDWAKRAKANHPPPGQRAFEIKQLMNWLRQELLVRGLPIDE